MAENRDYRLNQRNTASDIVEQDKKAKVDSARIQTPFIGPQTQDDARKSASTPTSPSDLLRPVPVTTTNANCPKVLLTDNANGRVDGTPGEGVKGPVQQVSNKDSNKSETVSASGTPTEVPVADEFRKDIIPKENPFKGFATMTYSVSLYLMGSKEYASMISSGKKTVNGLTLLLQSGGISNTPEGNHGAKRSERFFKRDFYIDDIELKGLVSGTSVGSPHNQFSTSFTITEPNGLTFLEELYGIVQEHNIKNGVSSDRINYAAQNYLMVVRFYGYDKNGKQITGRDIGVSESLSDLSSISEKYIPFQFTGIQFALENAVVKYKCEAVCPQTQVPFGVANSTIPFNTELLGQSVSSVLAGSEEGTDAHDSMLANYPATLVDTLNTEQARLVGVKAVVFPHKYVIEFEENGGIGTASVLTAGEFTDKDNVPMTAKGPEALLTNKGFYDKNKKLFSITAGQSIVQAIDMIVRTSTFTTSQQNINIDEVTGKVSKKANAPTIFQWFKIRTQVTPLKYDNKRNDYAYEIKYVVSRYQVNNIRSPYYGPTKFRGTHKEYDYWFTGKNTEVIDFRQEYNYLYYQTFGADMGIPQMQNNSREITKQVYQNSSSESSQGRKNRANEGSANAASLLYSPSDQANAQLTIIGDPDWIAQSEIFYSPDANGIGLGPFMHDGSINYDASEVLFSVNYNTNVDYDLKTGVADVGNKNYGRNLGSGEGGLSRMSLVYRANIITTNLSDGKFTQLLEGTLMMFPTDAHLAKEKAEKEILLTNQHLNDINSDADELAAELYADELNETDFADGEGDFDRLMRLQSEGRDD